MCSDRRIRPVGGGEHPADPPHADGKERELFRQQEDPLVQVTQEARVVGVWLHPDRNLRVLQELLQDPEKAGRVVIAVHGEGVKALMPLQGDISIARLCRVRIFNKSLKTH